MQQHSSRVVVRTKIGRSLYERSRSDGKHSYEADFTDPLNGRQRRKTLVARNRTEARQAQADLLSKLGRGEAVAPTSRTLADVSEEWLAQLSVKPRTHENYAMHFRVSINPILGRRKIQSITPQDVALLITHLREVRKLSGWTSAGALQALNGAMTHAVWMGLIASNPVAQLPRGKRPKRDQREEHRFLSGSEIQTLIEAMPPSYRAVVYTAVWTGMRESENLGLVWGDIDLSAAKIHLTAQLSRPTKDHPSERVPLKTNKARSIDIDPELVAYLRARREQQFALGFAKPTDYVFCTLPDGKPINFRNLTKAFSKAADRAGLNPDGKRKLRFHDLRRTHASI
jgi:integrase